MRRPRAMPAGAVEELSRLLKEAKTRGEFQRVQCVWLRAALGMSSEEVARAVGWHPVSVRRVQARYLKEGAAALRGVGRGGRRNENLMIEQEGALLRQFLAQADKGGILEVSTVKAAYEGLAGHQVPKSTVYRMLKRHGWRKVVPRPRHPKSNPARQAGFKKNSA